MPLLTICIPAYRSGPQLAAALQSVKEQSFQDFRCVIGFDPPADDQMRFVAPFLIDPRFRCYENVKRLGWDGNVATLMAGVATPLFTVLLHDDMIHAAYLEILVARMTADPSLSVAYSDLWQFGGHEIPGIRFMAIPEQASRIERVTAFLLQGAEAASWRGVARSAILRDHAFPIDGFGGFAAECEWNLRLLMQGPAHRVRRPLYYKRYATSGATTATRRWAELPLDALIAAWSSHRARMVAMIDEISEADVAQRHAFHAAAEAALLSRLIEAVRPNRTPAAVREPMESLIDRANSAISHHLLEAGGAAVTARVEAVRMMANALWAMWQQDWEQALALSTEAAARDPENLDALFARARMLVRLKRYKEALEPALAVASASPPRRGQAELLRTISNALMAERQDVAPGTTS